MQYASSLFERRRSILCILLLGIGAGAYASDSYNGVDLTIPTAIIGGAHFSNMIATPGTILGVAHGAPNGSVDVYNPATGELSIPSVIVGATTFTNVTITVGGLVSIGSVSGADTFNGTYVLSPVVQVLGGGPIYNTVMFKVGTIVSLGGGMPRNIRDVYDPVTHQVTIAAIQVGSTVYTNAVVTLGNAVFANGTGIPVPNVVGDTPADAELAIGAVGMTVGTISMQLSATVAAGNVISQSPTMSNFGYPSGTAVNLVVSAGATGILVPNVVGDTQAAASTAILAAGLTVGSVTTASSNTIAAGDVISESPAAGTGVLSGTAVSLVISSGGTLPAESLVYSFGAPSGNTGGYYPGALIQAANGSLYGADQTGGTNNNGTIFKLTLGGAESLLFTFPHPTTSGVYIPNGLVQGKLLADNGNFYGTTQGGGTYGGGTLYKLSAAGTQTVLYNFCGCLDNLGYVEGQAPGGLVEGSDGNLYGVTQGGQGSSGTVFLIPPAGLGQVLYAFGTNGNHDGQTPDGELIQGTGGDLYGVTDRGGANGTGTVFRVTTSGAETILYSFGPTSGHDAQTPIAGVVQDTNGNLYGRTAFGGTNNTGAIFRLTPGGLETVLYSFGPPVSSKNPMPTALILGSDGNLYGGTTYGGTYNIGMIFKITPSGTFSVVHSFSAGGVDAAYPDVLVQGADGNLYGSALAGGANGGGAIFKITL